MNPYLPDHMKKAVKNYLEEGIPPGHFLTAVLCNDLKEAIARADDINILALPNIVSWFYNNAPKACWGSEDNFNSWIESKRDPTPWCAQCGARTSRQCSCGPIADNE